MSLQQRVDSDQQLARLLQIGIVLEEVAEARANNHRESLPEPDADLESLLVDAAELSAAHRDRLEGLIDELAADSIPFDEINALVEASYGQTKPDDFDGVLYDQLCNEETAYKFYDDMIDAIDASDATFSVDREHLLSVLRELRDAERDAVEIVTTHMEERE
ncbi:ferritin-like domain-containing protein [Halonotius sp. F2-221B]|uniref:ferritin-like domain-containing protein n=1 Tax=Halonotius sp. F2-221B TaxID=2731620 RepID=UPI00398ADAB2